MEFAVPPEVAVRLGYYVYLYVDPRSGDPFYVEKGQADRALAHLIEKGESRKTKVLKELSEAGLEPRIDVLAHSLPDEKTALLIEAAVIDLLGLDNLTNLVRGRDSIEFGRVPLKELIFQYAAKPVAIVDRVIIVRINRQFRPGMLATALYEATRGIWKLGHRRENAKYALVVFEGVVREVYEIDDWFPAGTLKYETRDNEPLKARDRWEFTGCPASNEVRNRYVGGSVTEYLSKGAQNPIKYVNC